MFKTLILFIVLLPFECLAQSAISGRVLNSTGKVPLANASVFLSNATIGDKTADDGTFTLRNVQPGKYDLVVSVVGFETYIQTILVGSSNIKIADIALVPKTISLKEVNIKPAIDHDRQRKYEWFKEEFLGTSELAKECKILNPDVLDLDYDEEKGILTASSYDFLEIENGALGYKVKYLVKKFVLNNKDLEAKKIFYEGSVLFEDMKGTPGQLRRWQNRRQQIYEGSLMHFLRSAVNNQVESAGFRVLRYGPYPNPERPPDSLINAKITSCRQAGKTDSVAFWVKKSRLPKMLKKLFETPLSQDEIIQQTEQKVIYKFGSKGDSFNISFNKEHHFFINNNPYYLNGPNNRETSFVVFYEPYAFFDRNGSVINPGSMSFTGIWLKYRIAGLLPVDYIDQAKPIVKDSTAADKVITRFKNFSDQHVTEKAYLHFDKPYYAAGDTVYFKAYVTLGDEHRPSDLSGVLRVDLINTANKIDQSLKLQITDGVAWGDFALPDSLPKGNYRVRAYTQWMRNEGSGAYFDQTIPIGSTLKNKIPESASKQPAHIQNSKADLQFFPEGGSLVTGIRSKVAFKAIGPNGLGIDVKGVVVDNDNKEAASFTSAHLGMGYFSFTPQLGKTYRAQLTYPDGTQNVTDLPPVLTKGITLSVNNDSLPKASVRIEASKAYYEENKGKEYLLLIYSGGIATSVSCRLDSSVITVDILKRRLHTGIATVTLFSASGEPLGERLLFVQNYDQLSFALNPDRSAYSKREKANIGIKIKNRADEPSTGHFSVSVTDEGKVPFDENEAHTILTDLLLTSGLKGNIEQPNYYFSKINDTTLANLDLVMLTHGYRRFEWKKLLNNEYPPIAFQPEKTLEITGTAKSLTGKPLVKGSVSLISPKGPLLTQQTDDNGRFRFSNLLFTDTAKFVLQAVNAGGQNTTQLTYNRIDNAQVMPASLPAGKDSLDKTMAVYLDNAKLQQQQLSKFGKGRALKEVNIKAVKREDNYRSSSLAGPGHADQVMHAEEIENMGGPFSDRLNGRLRGVIFFTGKGGTLPYLTSSHTGPMLIVLDGEVMSPDFRFNDINGSNVETIEVLKYPGSASIYGMGAGNGVLVITTKQGTGKLAKEISSIGILPITASGFYKAREFYSPKYESPPQAGNRPDLRTTIYWNPEIVVDKDGDASIAYFNADGPGTYRVVIEGMDERGNIGRQVFRYKVN